MINEQKLANGKLVFNNRRERLKKAIVLPGRRYVFIGASYLGNMIKIPGRCLFRKGQFSMIQYRHYGIERTARTCVYAGDDLIIETRNVLIEAFRGRWHISSKKEYDFLKAMTLLKGSD